MTVGETLSRLEALGSDRMRAMNEKNGANGPQFGVKLGDIRKVAKEIKEDHELALSLWRTENVDARLLAILILKPRSLSAGDVDRMVRETRCPQVADWFTAYVVKKHPEKETLRERWMAQDDSFAARAGWSLTAERVAKNPEGLDISALLDRIEVELVNADPAPQWTMNMALAEIGIQFANYRDRAVQIGETHGVYRDYPVSKGCTSPFAPIWIAEIVRRQG